MMNYAVVEISGRQFKVLPNTSLLVDFLGEDVKSLDCDKVLLISDGDKLEVGAPFLKEVLKFEVLSAKKQQKIRVAKYHSKANTRKVKGSRRTLSEIILKAKDL